MQAAADLGTAIAQRGWQLINGAGKDGCMGAMNDACFAAGGQAHGVILRKFADENLGHPQIQDMVIAIPCANENFV